MAIALKEWAVVSEAIARGDQVVTIRKGGIHEKVFAVDEPGFWLFPNWAHQAAATTRSAWHGELARSDRERPADDRHVPVRARCQVVRHWELDAADPDVERRLRALGRFHLWTDAYVLERLRFRPTRPLVVMLLRAHALVDPVLVERTADHDGCLSWVEIPEIPTDALIPSLTDEAFARWSRGVAEALDGVPAIAGGRA